MLHKAVARANRAEERLERWNPHLRRLCAGRTLLEVHNLSRNPDLAEQLRNAPLSQHAADRVSELRLAAAEAAKSKGLRTLGAALEVGYVSVRRPNEPTLFFSADLKGEILEQNLSHAGTVENVNLQASPEARTALLHLGVILNHATVSLHTWFPST